MRVYLIPRYISKENIPFKVDASVEAEYGSMIIEGDVITLAHHTQKYKDYPAPCMQEVEKISDNSNVVISHIDLDTLGGIATLMGIKPIDDEFWSSCEFIDLNGPHHLYELNESIRNKIIAYEAYAAMNHMDKVMDITDVTSIVLDRIEVIRKIINNDSELINNGIYFYNKEQAEIESCLLCENDNVRVFYSPNGVFCNGNYFSTRLNKVIPYIVSYNGFYHSISCSSENGGKIISCRLIMQKLFGCEAGGHDGIAGSPRNMHMNKGDFIKVINEVNNLVNEYNHTDYKMEMKECLKLEIKE